MAGRPVPVCPSLTWLLLTQVPAPLQEAVVRRAAELLSEQWPEASVETRVAAFMRLLQQPSAGTEVILLLEKATHVIGHANVAPAATSKAVVTSVLVRHEYRGRGLGRFIVSECENVAKQSDSDYVCLSTPDKQAFYEHLGYHVCKPISSLKGNAHRLNEQQQTRLEKLFAGRLPSSAAPSAQTKAKNVWLCKRLKETHPCVYRSADEIRSDIRHAIGGGDWEVVYIDVPWVKQIGPSCGLAALNMIRDFLLKPPAGLWYRLRGSSSDSENEHVISSESTEALGLKLSTSPGSLFAANPSLASCQVPEKSLLQTAIESGYTVDGEMFSCQALCDLVHHHLRLQAQLIEDLTESAVLQRLLQGHLILLPYDRSANHQPCERSGRSAHWLCIHGWCIDTSTSSLIAIASHGLSKHLLCTPLEALVRSNTQLTGPIVSEMGVKLIGADSPSLACRAVAVKVTLES